MKITKFVTLFIISVLSFLTLNACGDGSKSVHEPLTIITAHKDYTEFEKEFKKAYPEVNLKFISYSGHNSTSYLHRILEAGQAPDIYTSNVLPDAELQKKYLIDLSGYDFSTKYAVSRLNECSINGAIYMLPCNYSVMGIYYNKTLFEGHGWSVPTSFYELEALLPKIKAAGVDVSATALELTGSGFHYLFNLGDTVFLRTPEGLEWVEQFLNEEVTADAAWASTIEYMQVLSRIMLKADIFLVILNIITSSPALDLPRVIPLFQMDHSRLEFTKYATFPRLYISLHTHDIISSPY